MKLFRSKAMKAVDALLIGTLGFPEAVLIENAGRAAAAFLQGKSPEGPELKLEPGFDVGYTVPQHVHKGAGDVEIFFRVRSVRRNTAIRVRDGQTQIARFRREHMAPGEMETIKLPRVLLDRVQGDTLTIEIEEAEA